MILADVLLRVLPELLVVVTPDDMATDARDLLHAVIVRRQNPMGFQRQLTDSWRQFDSVLAQMVDWLGARCLG